MPEKSYIAEVLIGGVWTIHSEHNSFRDAVDQADMVHGRVRGEDFAYRWAKSDQGFTGTFDEWMAQDDEERDQYENGASGIGTI